MSDVNFDQLLQAIPGDLPTGKNQNDDSLRARLNHIDAMDSRLKTWQDTVRTARFNLKRDPQTKIPTPPDDASWQALLDLLDDFITHHSKDIRQFGLLFKAATYVYGFAGYAAAVKAASQLVQRFGTDLHSDGRFEHQLKRSLSEASNEAIVKAFEEAELPGGLRGVDRKSESRDAKEFTQAMAQAPEEAARLLSQIEACRTAYAEYEETIVAWCSTPSEEKLQAFAIRYPELADRASELLALARPDRREPLQRLVGERAEFGELLAEIERRSDARKEFDWYLNLLTPEPASPEGAVADEAAATSSGALLVDNKSPGDRKAAITQIRQIAKYFRQIEPHSPISYALNRVADWGEMELPQLLTEIVGDAGAGDDAMGRFLFRAGVPQHVPEEPPT